MGFFERLSLLIRSNINALLNRAEDPEKALDQLTEDMQKEFVEAKKQVAVAIADERRLFRQVEKAQADATNWEQKAVTALSAGREDLARSAMQRKVNAEKEVAEYTTLWEAQKVAADRLRESLVKLNDRIEEAGRKKNILVARAKRAEAHKKIQTAMGNLGTSSALSHFERLENKVEQQEAEAEGVAMLSADEAAMGVEGLEAEFKQLESQQVHAEADAALLELKAKLGLDAPPAPAQLPAGDS